MSATKNKRAKYNCRRKVSHADKASAVRERERLTGGVQSPLEVYKCTVCPGWHVGHAPGSKHRTTVAWR